MHFQRRALLAPLETRPAGVSGVVGGSRVRVTPTRRLQFSRGPLNGQVKTRSHHTPHAVQVQVALVVLDLQTLTGLWTFSERTFLLHPRPPATPARRGRGWPLFPRITVELWALRPVRPVGLLCPRHVDGGALGRRELEGHRAQVFLQPRRLGGRGDDTLAPLHVPGLYARGGEDARCAWVCGVPCRDECNHNL